MSSLSWPATQKKRHVTDIFLSPLEKLCITRAGLMNTLSPVGDIQSGQGCPDFFLRAFTPSWTDQALTEPLMEGMNSFFPRRDSFRSRITHDRVCAALFQTSFLRPPRLCDDPKRRAVVPECRLAARERTAVRREAGFCQQPVNLTRPIFMSFRISTSFRRMAAGLLKVLPCATGVFLLSAGTTGAAEQSAMKRTQTISLTAGWNAVFLEVEPLDVAPAKVFEGKPVDIAAAYFAQEAPTQYVNNPGTQLFKGLGWGVWYAENRPDAFLKSLNAIYGQQAYLIHATQAFQWKVDGLASMGAVKWQPNSYNLTGFGVASPGAPSFGEFFVASPAHRAQPVYRLVNNVWKQVTNPAAEAMRSGEAFWIYCKGPSDYQGPLSVETSPRAGLLTLDSSGSIVLRNHTDHPVTPSLQHVTVDSLPVPLSINVRLTGDLSRPLKTGSSEKPAGPWTQAMPPLESGARIGIPFTARTAEMTAAQQGSLLKITTDMGTELWVPVISRRPDLDKK